MKAILLLTGMVLMMTMQARAQLGMTLSEVKAAWGEPIKPPVVVHGLGEADFHHERWGLRLSFQNGRVVEAIYTSDTAVDDNEVTAVLLHNGGDWTKTKEAPGLRNYKDGKGNDASEGLLESGGTRLCFWTKGFAEEKP